ncbi:glutamate--cysteine ligase EgtA [Marmoricola endophyticus]|uniref:Glutamate--cysteine ligase EgtA n=1 Tax=Marmoricola endophyticus TaxID=2040280 RepID=A0A917BCW5_9ACTN|nr:ergothioneine biosynthesis glutamate--cysteine ligase EgtA [Marmoricola endophyticus]GGF32515.1 glutamate--cysteine ligase EgtA [Marmoricola endophyticus]
MTATAVVDHQHVQDDVPLDELGDPVEVARAHVLDSALTESEVGPVGLELELHLVPADDPSRRPTWAEVLDLVAGLPAMPQGSAVTLEPGGQIELSTPPADGVVAAVEALRADRQVLRDALSGAGFGAAPLGADPARAARRINPSQRYDAMETHFDALGCAGAGRAMMTATAALQVNLDAGRREQWDERLHLIRSLVPVLLAVSSTSPYLGGTSDGWHSMRQGTWQGIDHGRSDPVSQGEPRAAWAFYALSAPVMLLRGEPADDGSVHCEPVTTRVPFAAWLRGESPFDRAPTLADLDYHLTTLFPPVRPRGWVEIRCLDAMPDRWWPAMAAITATLVDHPDAAAQALEHVEPVAEEWQRAARDGLADPAVRAAAVGCLEIALAHAPDALRDEVGELVELLVSGPGPAGLLRRHADAHGPLSLLEEEARA